MTEAERRDWFQELHDTLADIERRLAAVRWRLDGLELRLETGVNRAVTRTLACDIASGGVSDDT